MSCAFIVCDLTSQGEPIVYASEGFTQLTGYSSEETLGQNARFLQNPRGIIKENMDREYTDRRIVSILKSKIEARSETQVTLINYRKGGQPFLNLLSVIPICWNSNDYNLAVGFQLDLVENPQAITKKSRGESYRSI